MEILLIDGGSLFQVHIKRQSWKTSAFDWYAILEVLYKSIARTQYTEIMWYLVLQSWHGAGMNCNISCTHKSYTCIIKLRLLVKNDLFISLLYNFMIWYFIFSWRWLSNFLLINLLLVSSKLSSPKRSYQLQVCSLKRSFLIRRRHFCPIRRIQI